MWSTMHPQATFHFCFYFLFTDIDLERWEDALSSSLPPPYSLLLIPPPPPPSITDGPTDGQASNRHEDAK